MNVYVISVPKEFNIIQPTLSQVIEVVRQSSGHHRKRIDENTLIEADLDICGMDGDALIEDCEAAIRDLTVGELHAVLVKAVKEQIHHD